MTLTQTLAWRRSGVVSTEVIVANPIRGSATSRATIDPISWRSSSSMRSVRWLIGVAPAERPDARSSAGHATDRLRGKALDHIALLEIMEVRQADAALVVRGDFPDVVAEPSKRLDPVCRDDLSSAPHPGVPADDPAVGHERSGDDRVLADPEDLADFGTALHDLDHLGLEETLQRG